MSPQRRSALASVVAAAALVVLKLSVGLATHSLGFVSEAIHSGTDLVAALLTFFAVGVSARPADRTHQFGHGKAEHLSALAEAGFLSAASVFISVRAIEQLAGITHSRVNPTWYAFVVLGVVISIDLSRTFVSWRTSRRYGSAALASNALHFGSDLAGSFAVLVGLVLADAGYPKGDPLAALFVGVLVLLGDRVRLLERQLARQLHVQRELRPPVDVDQRDVVHLAHARDGDRRGVHALAQRLVGERLDVDDDVGAR